MPTCKTNWKGQNLHKQMKQLFVASNTTNSNFSVKCSHFYSTTIKVPTRWLVVQPQVNKNREKRCWKSACENQVAGWGLNPSPPLNCHWCHNLLQHYSLEKGWPILVTDFTLHLWYSIMTLKRWMYQENKATYYTLFRYCSNHRVATHLK